MKQSVSARTLEIETDYPRHTHLRLEQLAEKVTGGPDLAPIRAAKAPDDIWMAYEGPVTTRYGTSDKIVVCDWASAGKTWDKNSLYATFLA